MTKKALHYDLDRRTDGPTDMDKQMNRLKDGATDGPTDKWADQWADKWINGRKQASKKINNNIQYFVNHPILSVFTSPKCSSCNSAFENLSNDMLHNIVCLFSDLNKTILLLIFIVTKIPSCNC